MFIINPLSEQMRRVRRMSPYFPMGIPRGMGSLAGYLLKQNKNVIIFDEQVQPLTIEIIDSMVKELTPPYIFGFSCITENINRGYELAGMIKNKYGGAKVIFGGMHPTVLPEEALNTGLVDIVVRKEGEIILHALYETIKKGADYSDTAGISYQRNGTIIHNPSSAPIDLNILGPFPYHLFEKNASSYYFGFVSASRGCPSSCIFCCQHIISQNVFRSIPLKNVMTELELLIGRYRQKIITFVDDNFLSNKERVQELCDSICAKGLHKKAAFDCQARCDGIDGPTLQYLKKANFRSINFGLETGSERLMALINKNETVGQNETAVRLAKKYGFQVSATFLLGLPTETTEDRRATFRFARRLSLNYLTFKSVVPFPGTKLYEMAMEEGRLYTGKNWENLNLTIFPLLKGDDQEEYLLKKGTQRRFLPYVPEGTKETRLIKDILKINFYFLLRPKSIRRLLFGDKFGPFARFILPEKWYFNIKDWLYISKSLFRTACYFLKD